MVLEIVAFSSRYQSGKPLGVPRKRVHRHTSSDDENNRKHGAIDHKQFIFFSIKSNVLIRTFLKIITFFNFQV